MCLPGIFVVDDSPGSTGVVFRLWAPMANDDRGADELRLDAGHFERFTLAGRAFSSNFPSDCHEAPKNLHGSEAVPPEQFKPSDDDGGTPYHRIDGL
jgi:hypothetical protein